MSFDAVVIGGGPGGSVCAARLAATGRRVVVLERERHPRFHLGESLLPASLGVLETIGVLDTVRERFLEKRGARFVDGSDGTRTVRYAFEEAFKARHTHAFQVPRDAFDELLLRRAAACGADVREEWTATRIAFEGDRAVGVEARDPAGNTHAIAGKVVVDASGRAAVLTRTRGTVERIPHLDRTAIYTQVRGAWRDTGERTGDIQIAVFGEGEQRGWFWLIPFRDGRTSVGAVVSSAWLRAHEGRPEALLDAAIAEAPAVGAMLSGAERLFVPRATADFSFRVTARHGHGWLAVGDAGGFIDPLFSTGAHLAMHGALLAADAIDAALAAGDVGAARFDAFAREVRLGADLFVGAVQAFYAGDLTQYIFAEPQHPFLRRAITSMLSGNVFDEDERWVREMHARFPPRA